MPTQIVSIARELGFYEICTHSPSALESLEMPRIDICNSARAATSIFGQLYAPQSRVQCGHGPDEPACPTVQPHEFVKVHMCEKGYGENGKGWALEGEEDTKWEESEGNKTCSAPGSPPGLLDRVLRLVCRNIARHQTPEELVRGSDVVWPYESGRQADGHERDETE
jgi:hypothetical protein